MNTDESYFGLLIIGDEILSGRRKDKHLDKAIEILTHHDLQLSWARYVGDDETILTQHFREIHQLGHHCFSFGGIGATVDDRTRQAVARALKRDIHRHPEASTEIEAQFGKQAYPHRILMADLPDGSDIIPNPYNRIPGFTIENIHCLPGFPEMAWPMMEWVLENKYQHLEKIKIVQYSIILKGSHESDLIELLEQFQHQHPHVKISSLPHMQREGIREIELGIQGAEPDATTAKKCITQTLLSRGLIHSA